MTEEEIREKIARGEISETTPPAPLSPAVHGGDEAPPEGYEVNRESSSPLEDALVSGEGPTDKAMAREPENAVGGSADAPQAPKASRDGKRVVEPLTPAEKQQRHRDKVKADPVRYEAHLLKERERKRDAT